MSGTSLKKMRGDDGSYTFLRKEASPTFPFSMRTFFPKHPLLFTCT